MLCGADLLKGNIDEGLQGQLQIVDVDIELKKVPVKLSSIEVQQIIWLPLDVIHNVVEVLDHLVQPIQVGVLGQRGELVDGIKHADQLLASLGEEIKLVEDLRLIKVKRAGSRLTLQERTACCTLQHSLCVQRTDFVKSAAVKSDFRRTRSAQQK